MRKKLQKQGKFRKLKLIKNRECKVVKDLNHKISEDIVEFAHKTRLRLEDLKGIRETVRSSRSFRYFEQLQFPSA